MSHPHDPVTACRPLIWASQEQEWALGEQPAQLSLACLCLAVQLFDQRMHVECIRAAWLSRCIQ